MPDVETNAVKSEVEPPVEGEGGVHGDEDSKPAQEGSTADTLDGQNMGTEVLRKPFYYLIRLPRYDDVENIKEQIKYDLHQVDEKIYEMQFELKTKLKRPFVKNMIRMLELQYQASELLGNCSDPSITINELQLSSICWDQKCFYNGISVRIF